MRNDYGMLNTAAARTNFAETESYDIVALNDQAGPVLASMPEPFHKSVMRMNAVTGAGMKNPVAQNDVAPIRNNNVTKLGRGAPTLEIK